MSVSVLFLLLNNVGCDFDSDILTYMYYFFSCNITIAVEPIYRHCFINLLQVIVRSSG